MNEQRYKDLFKKSDQKTRTILASVEFGEKIDQIASLYKLSEDSKKYLSRLIIEIYLGLNSVENTRNSLRFILDDENQIEKIAGSVKMTFFDAKENLYNEVIRNLNGGDEGVQSEMAGGDTFSLRDYNQGVSDKINEITTKYALSQIQKNSLQNLLLNTKNSPVTRKNLAQSISDQTGVSSVISELVTDDLITRVFVSNRNTDSGKKIDTISRSPIPKVIIPSNNEIEKPATIRETFSNMPPNLPVSEEDKEFVGQKVDIPRYIPTRIETIKEEEAKKYEALKQEAVRDLYPDTNKPEENQNISGFTSPVGSRITYKPTSSVVTKPDEIVQRTMQVPRVDFSKTFNDEVAENVPENIPAPPAQAETTTKIAESVINPEPKTETPIIKSYTVDPYREPF